MIVWLCDVWFRRIKKKGVYKYEVKYQVILTRTETSIIINHFEIEWKDISRMTSCLSDGISTTLTDITMMDNVKFFLSVRITLIIIDYTLFVLIAIKDNCTQFTIN